MQFIHYLEVFLWSHCHHHKTTRPKSTESESQQKENLSEFARTAFLTLLDGLQIPSTYMWGSSGVQKAERR